MIREKFRRRGERSPRMPEDSLERGGEGLLGQRNKPSEDCAVAFRVRTERSPTRRRKARPGWDEGTQQESAGKSGLDLPEGPTEKYRKAQPG